MKKLILLACMTVIGNIYAIPRSEMISKDLSKIGISKEIIDETIKLDKELANVSSEMDNKKIKKVALEMENLLKKDERNFIICEKLIAIYNVIEKPEKEQEKNLKLYEKYNPHEASKLFFKNLYYANKKDFKSFDINDEKLKKNYPDHLITIIALTYKLGFETIFEIMKEDEKAGLATLRKIVRELADKKKTEESHISDEEAFAYKLTMGWIAISFYLSENRTQDAIDFYYENFEGKNRPNKEIFDYTGKQNMFIKENLAMANKEDFSENKRVFDENFKKINIFFED